MTLHSDTLFWFRANQFLLLLLNAACLAEKQQIQILLSLVWHNRGSIANSRSAAPLHHRCGCFTFKVIGLISAHKSNYVIQWSVGILLYITTLTTVQFVTILHCISASNTHDNLFVYSTANKTTQSSAPMQKITTIGDKSETS